MDGQQNIKIELDDFSGNLISEYFSKLGRESSDFFEI